jgi:hypothetical protein
VRGWSLLSSSWDKIMPIAKSVALVLTIVGSSGLKCCRIGAIVKKDFSLLKEFSASVVRLNFFLFYSCFVRSISSFTTLEKLCINRQ